MPVSRLLGFPHTPVPMATDRRGAAEPEEGFQWRLHADPGPRPGRGLHGRSPMGVGVRMGPSGLASTQSKWQLC